MRLRFSFLALALSLVALLATTASAAAAPRPAYTALGDSYTAGDGTGVFYSGSPCYRSPEAYPPRVAAAGRYNLTFAACSGAKTGDVINNQLGSLNDNTKLVTIQIGGNDVGFSTVIGACLPNLFSLPTTACGTAIGLAKLATDYLLPTELGSVYTAIKTHAPYAKVLVLGYPQLFDPQGTTCQPTFAAGMSSSDELALNGAAANLDSVIEQEAKAYDFTYVSPVNALIHHEVCSTDPWINGIGFFPINEWFHPNAGGEAAFANLIEQNIR